MIWKPLDDPRMSKAITAELRSWHGTPYMAGQCSKGQGVDCVRFCFAVLDAAHNFPAAREVAAFPVGIAFHKDTRGMMLELSRRYPERMFHNRGLGGLEVSAGDLIVARIGEGRRMRPGHLAIVGPEPMSAWHATQAAGVCRTSIAALGSVVGVWTFKDKTQWFSPSSSP